MSLDENPLPFNSNDEPEKTRCSIDRFARMLGYQDIDHAIETEKALIRTRLLEIAKREGGITLYHQTTPESASRIRREGFKLCEAQDPPDALCFAFAHERTDDVANHLGVIATVRLPLTWLLHADWDFDLAADGIYIREDVPASFVREFRPRHFTGTENA